MKQHGLGPSKASIDHLPAELLHMILLAIDSALALHAFIAAYPRAFGIFKADRSRILRAVLQNSIFFENLRDLLFVDALQNPRLEPLLSLAGAMGPDHLLSPISWRGRELKRAIRPWIERYFMGEAPDYPEDMKGIIRLLRVLTVVTRFAELYARHAAHLIVSPEITRTIMTPRQFPIGFPPLTRDEERRFQRAFLRYELYSRLFRRDPAPTDTPVGGQRHCRMSIFTAQEQHRYFIRRLDPWSVEELNCVHNFLFALVRGWMAEVEDQVVHAVRTARGAYSICDGGPGYYLQQPFHEGEPSAFDEDFDDVLMSEGAEMVRYKDMSTSSHPSEESTGGDNMDVSPRRSSASSDSLFYYNGGVSRTQHHSKLTSFGLPVLRRLHDATPDNRRDMMRREGLSGRDFLPEALVFAPDPRVMTLPGAIPLTSPTRMRGTLPYWPLSWGAWPFDDRSYRRVYDYDGGLAYNPSRERAYIFWGEDRLEDPEVARNILAVADVSPDEVRKRSSLGPTIEERVWDIRLPMRERRRIRKKFGFYENHDLDTIYEEEGEEDDEPQTLPELL